MRAPARIRTGRLRPKPRQTGLVVLNRLPAPSTWRCDGLQPMQDCQLSDNSIASHIFAGHDEAPLTTCVTRPAAQYHSAIPYVIVVGDPHCACVLGAARRRPPSHVSCALASRSLHSMRRSQLTARVHSFLRPQFVLAMRLQPHKRATNDAHLYSPYLDFNCSGATPWNLILPIHAYKT